MAFHIPIHDRREQDRDLRFLAELLCGLRDGQIDGAVRRGVGQGVYGGAVIVGVDGGGTVGAGGAVVEDARAGGVDVDGAPADGGAAADAG